MEDFDPIAYINEPRWQQVRPGLERIDDLLDRMGRPQDRLRFVHVAGTNGKGSICAFVSQALQCAGYKTGMFTSPFIIRFEERIRVNGANIELDDLRSVTSFVREHAEAMMEQGAEHPTEFELMTAVAFEHFARSECDIVVCEVGLGGRLDSTNVIRAPEACVIARLGLDHTGVLGNTIEEIAAEKAGIVKAGSSVVSWPQDQSAMRVIEDVVAEQSATLVIPDFDKLTIGAVEGGMRSFTYDGDRFETKLLGSYQPYNAVLAIEALRVLAERGWRISDGNIARGVRETSWPGRFEVVAPGPPCIIVDGGHNPQGAAVLAESLKDVFPDKRIVFLMSVLADKDYRAMIRCVLPRAAAFVCAASSNPRALSADELAQAIREEAQEARGGNDIIVESFGGFGEAMHRARELAQDDGVICAFGSLYSIAEVNKAIAS